MGGFVSNETARFLDKEKKRPDPAADPSQRSISSGSAVVAMVTSGYQGVSRNGLFYYSVSIGAGLLDYASGGEFIPRGYAVLASRIQRAANEIVFCVWSGDVLHAMDDCLAVAIQAEPVGSYQSDGAYSGRYKVKCAIHSGTVSTTGYKMETDAYLSPACLALQSSVPIFVKRDGSGNWISAVDPVPGWSHSIKVDLSFLVYRLYDPEPGQNGPSGKMIVDPSRGSKSYSYSMNFDGHGFSNGSVFVRPVSARLMSVQVKYGNGAYFPIESDPFSLFPQKDIGLGHVAVSSGTTRLSSSFQNHYLVPAGVGLPSPRIDLHNIHAAVTI